MRTLGFVGIAGCVLVGCQNGRDESLGSGVGTQTATSTESTAAAESGVGSEGESNGGPGGVSTDDSESDDGPQTGGETGGYAGSACETLIACVQEATPEAQTQTIATYGPEGTCWDLPGVTPEDCIAECRALLADLTDIYSEIAACWECASDVDCEDVGANFFCEQHSCIAPIFSCVDPNSSPQCVEYTDPAWTEDDKDGDCQIAGGETSPEPCSQDGVAGECASFRQSPGQPRRKLYFYCPISESQFNGWMDTCTASGLDGEWTTVLWPC